MMQAYSLDGVSESLKKAYKLFTDGKFSAALQAFNQMLWTIPLVVVASRQEVDEVKELITICRYLDSTAENISTGSFAVVTCVEACIGPACKIPREFNVCIPRALLLLLCLVQDNDGICCACCSVELRCMCREYNIALRTEMKRREIANEDPKRNAELAAYFTHAKLQPYHTALALGSAMRIFSKQKNYNTCATFCRRLLELNSTQKVSV